MKLIIFISFVSKKLQMRKRIVIKVGSNVLTREDKKLDITRMSSLVDQIAALRQMDIEVLLISSGAVASGRSEVQVSKTLDSVSARQLYSAVGQAKLINRYYEFFREQGLNCGQVLTTKENFSSRKHYLTQKHCMEVMLKSDVIPIINENDTVSVTELMFTDNDELSGLIASMMNADTLIILSNIDGVYDGNPKDPKSRVIREIQAEQGNLESYIQTEKSSFGRGGMLTKCNIARKVAAEGIEVIIANGCKDKILTEILSHPVTTICTRFVPNLHAASNIKKWIAHSEDFAKGSVYVNAGAEEVISSPQASSLLFVGITRIEGDFEKDDLVHIYSEDGRLLGIGCTYFDSNEARLLIGKKDHKPMIHYDYLWLK